MKIVPVILSGGTGTRLWPLSRKSYPKQLLALLKDNTLLQETVKRMQGFNEVTEPLIVCSEAHYFIIHEQLDAIGIKPLDIILEPSGRNTAPAAAIAAMHVREKLGENAVILLMPADHIIEDTAGFRTAVRQGLASLQSGALLTFGVQPSAPRTGYGYIKTGKQITDSIFEVDQFVEKPSLEVAKTYLDKGGYYWNSGIFMFTVDAYLSESRQHMPDVVNHCQQSLNEAHVSDNYVRLLEENFMQCQDISIDYAVMEKTQHACVVPMDVGWADVGDWAALAEKSEPDENGNVIKGDVFVEDVKNSYLFSEDRLLAAIGLEDCVIVETYDAVLVTHKDHCQKVKKIVEKLRQMRHSTADSHYKVRCPWGFYETLAQGNNFRIKRVTVNPGCEVESSVNAMFSGHWVVINGDALISFDEETIELAINQSTYIPKNIAHKVKNTGASVLELVEVQSGETA